MSERRTRRSEKTGQALNLFLESLRLKRGVPALALTTDDGLLVAAAGTGDLEWMGAIGAARRRRQVEWENRDLHVQKVEVNDLTLWLTSEGQPVSDDNALGGICRILAA
jgi:hypothetical protein